MNWKVLTAAGGCLFVLGIWVGRIGQPTNEELGVAHQVTQEALAKATEAEQAREAIQVQADAQIAQNASRSDSALRVARAAESRRPTVVDRIVNREAPADTGLARRVATAVADSIETNEVRPLYAALAASDSVIAAKDRLLVAEREARLAAQDGLRTALVETKALRDARPGWARRNAPQLALVVGLAGGYWLRGHLAP